VNYKFSLLDSGSTKARAHWVRRPPVIVGRDPSCDILINDPSISRRHCQFTLDADGALVVRDLGSTNGVYVEDRRVSKAIVRPGEIVQIGSVLLRPEWTDQLVGGGRDSAPSSEATAIEVIDLGETQPMRIVEIGDSGFE
jgi:pSer/pThr/pTyr-binding forkhead associated (FHA) protein